MVHKVKGSITVFLSLILVMVLALIGTLLDAARINMASSYSYRALVSAIDTEFTKYCSELYEDYHIYMLGNGHSLSNVSGEEFINSMTKYLMYSFDSDSNLSMLHTSFGIKATDLLELSVDNCNVDSITKLTDYNGVIFQDQVAQYMKYYVAGEAAESILGKLNLLNQSKETMTIIRKKNEVDEKVAKVDKSILKLMQEVEGITFKNNQLQVTKEYTIKVQNSFAKKFCTTEVKPRTVSIDHEVVWDSLRNQYINPVEKLKAMKQKLEDFSKVSEEITILEGEIEEIDKKIDELKNPPATSTPTVTETPMPTPTATQSATATPTPTESPKPSEEMVNQQIKELEDTKKEKEEQLSKKKDEQKSYLPKVREEAASLYDQADNVRNHTIQAINQIDCLNNEKTEGLNALTSFDSDLKNSKDKIDSETYEGLQKDYKETKEYMSQIDENGKDTSVVGTVVNMRPTLCSNKAILDETTKLMDTARGVPETQVEEMKNQISALITKYDNYSIKELRFDYSTLTVHENTESPLTSFGSLVNTGLLELVVDDTSKLSNVQLDSSKLVSNTCGNQQIDTKKDEKSSNDMAEKVAKGDAANSGISDSLKGYEDNCESANVTDSGVNDIARKVLINEYGVTNFKNLMDDLNQGGVSIEKGSSGKKTSNKVNLKKEKTQEKKGKTKEEQKTDQTKSDKPTKIKYEQEYLAIGGYNELDNVKSIVMRTIFMRTAGNYIALLTNSKCRDSARATAKILVGFTGLTPLIILTTQLILIAWGFEEALVDTRALLDGNSIPIIKKAADFNIEYKDLLSISKETIRNKAKNYKQGKSKIIGLSYNDYLRIYLLMVPSDTLSYRMMDLIQENMKVRYDDQFQIMNGIFGTKVSLTATMPGKFLNIPFIKNTVGYDGAEAKVKVSTEYSY